MKKSKSVKPTKVAVSKKAAVKAAPAKSSKAPVKPVKVAKPPAKVTKKSVPTKKPAASAKPLAKLSGKPEKAPERLKSTKPMELPSVAKSGKTAKAQAVKMPVLKGAPKVAEVPDSKPDNKPDTKTDKKAAKGVEAKIAKVLETKTAKTEAKPIVIEEPDQAEDVVLTDAEGRRYCRVKDCDRLAEVDAYCRYHYILLWKNIQTRRHILQEGKLERYIEELTARYPDKFLEILKKDLRSEKDFLAAIQELEIDESAVEAEFDDEESQSDLFEIQRVSDSGGGARSEEDDRF